MKLRSSIGTALAAAAGVLALTAGTAVAAAPAAHATTKAATKIATHLTLASSTASTTAGTWITLTAHLDKHGTNRTVTVYGQAWGHGDKPFVVGTGAVDKHGNLTVKYHTYQNHTFWATFSGGTAYAASQSGQRIVRTAPKVTAALGGYYTSIAWKGHTVREFHKTTNIHVEGAVSPNKGAAVITIQAYGNQGTWVGSDKESFTTAANGTYNLNTGKDTAVGAVFRVLISTKGDALNPAGSSSWLYLTATK